MCGKKNQQVLDQCFKPSVEGLWKEGICSYVWPSAVVSVCERQLRLGEPDNGNMVLIPTSDTNGVGSQKRCGGRTCGWVVVGGGL